jgi:hypothetical protein
MPGVGAGAVGGHVDLTAQPGDELHGVKVADPRTIPALSGKPDLLHEANEESKEREGP